MISVRNHEAQQNAINALRFFKEVQIILRLKAIDNLTKEIGRLFIMADGFLSEIKELKLKMPGMIIIFWLRKPC